MDCSAAHRTDFLSLLFLNARLELEDVRHSRILDEVLWLQFRRVAMAPALVAMQVVVLRFVERAAVLTLSGRSSMMKSRLER